MSYTAAATILVMFMVLLLVIGITTIWRETQRRAKEQARNASMIADRLESVRIQKELDALRKKE